MLSEFYNEVLGYGPVAVLPQNLDDKWIQRLQKMADDFLDSNFNLYDCTDAREIGDPVLAACVYEILRYQYSEKYDLTPKEMAEKIGAAMRDGDVILLKGSRKMQLEIVAEILKGRDQGEI